MLYFLLPYYSIIAYSTACTDKFEGGPSSRELEDFNRYDHYDDIDFIYNYYEYEQGRSEPIVKGRLLSLLNLFGMTLVQIPS